MQPGPAARADAASPTPQPAARADATPPTPQSARRGSRHPLGHNTKRRRPAPSTKEEAGRRMDSVHFGPPRSLGSVPSGRYSERFPESSRLNSPSGGAALPQVPGRRTIHPPRGSAARQHPGPSSIPGPGRRHFSATFGLRAEASAPQFPAPGSSPGPGRQHFSQPSAPERRQPRSAAMNSGQRVQRFSVRSHSSRACAPTEGCSLSMSRR